MKYVDGFVVPVPEDQIDLYRKIATKAGKIWMEHGALEYRECVVEDGNVEQVIPFAKQMKCKPGETVVLAWIVYKSRAHRDKVNKLVLADPRMADMIDPKTFPINMKRMVHGGFETLVDLTS